jgi:hypothetical protein
MSPLTRREFMKTFGVSLASLIIAGCRLSQLPPQSTSVPQNPLSTSVPPKTPTLKPTQTQELVEVQTCYIVVTVVKPTAITLSPRNRLRACWLSFNELAAKTQSGKNSTTEDAFDNPFGAQLTADHRRALDELVAADELEPATADLVQEAYDAAVYHVWRSNVPITCYAPMMVDYAPTCAAQLVQQSAILAEMATKGDLNPDTVAIVQKTIQHDLAFEALSREEVDALYEKLLKEYPQYSDIPSFDQVELEVTPEMEAAAKFIVELLGETP